jgi:hypothetical protein
LAGRSSDKQVYFVLRQISLEVPERREERRLQRRKLVFLPSAPLFQG